MARMEVLGYLLPQVGDPLQDPQCCSITFHLPAAGDTGDTEPTLSPRLQKGVRMVAHMLRLTGRLAQTLDAASHRLHAELSRRLQSSAAHAAAAAEP